MPGGPPITPPVGSAQQPGDMRQFTDMVDLADGRRVSRQQAMQMGILPPDIEQARMQRMSQMPTLPQQNWSDQRYQVQPDQGLRVNEQMNQAQQAWQKAQGQRPQMPQQPQQSAGSQMTPPGQSAPGGASGGGQPPMRSWTEESGRMQGMEDQMRKQADQQRQQFNTMGGGQDMPFGRNPMPSNPFAGGGPPFGGGGGGAPPPFVSGGGGPPKPKPKPASKPAASKGKPPAAKAKGKPPAAKGKAPPFGRKK